MDIRQTIGKTMTRLFSTSSERYVKKRRDFNAELTTLPEEARKPAKKHLTDQLRDCCDDIIIEAFALVRTLRS